MGPGWIRNLGPLSRVCPWVRGCAVLRTTWAQTPSTGTWATVRGALFFVHRAGVREAGGRHFNQDATGVSAWAGPRGVHKSLRAPDLSRVGMRGGGWESAFLQGNIKKPVYLGQLGSESQRDVTRPGKVGIHGSVQTTSAEFLAVIVLRWAGVVIWTNPAEMQEWSRCNSVRWW